MLPRLASALRKVISNESGNVVLLFCGTLIPLLLLMGGAVDLVRYNRYKAQLSNGIDAASLSLGRKGVEMSEADAKKYVGEYLSSMSIPVVPDSKDPNVIKAALDQEFIVQTLDVKKTDRGYIVSALAPMRALFLPIGALTNSSGHGIRKMDIDVTAEVVHQSNRLELALALDNTGSMNCGATVTGNCSANWSNPGPNSRIAGLKNAALKLVDTVMVDTADPDQIKVALVPFEGAVNIKNDAFKSKWVDWSNQGKAYWNGRNFNKWEFDDEDDDDEKAVGHKYLFNKLGVTWAGCVEMRAGEYELSDAPPKNSERDSMFVPFFWRDEPDSSSYTYFNDYLNDQVSSSNELAIQASLKKYGLGGTVSWQSNSIRDLAKATEPPYLIGPNRGCPRPLLPLTDDKSDVEDEIENMVAFGGMGTFVPTGLMWGWHVLSPGEPFTEGVAPGDTHYDKTIKALVLLSDGENSVTGLSGPNRSTYSAFNYVYQGRLGTTSSEVAANAGLDTKTTTLCGSVKAANIRLYTITFGEIDNSTKTLMSNCATKDKGAALYYHAPSNAELESIFARIGEDLNEVHLAK